MARVDPIPAGEWSPDALASIEPLNPDGRRHRRPPKLDRSAGMGALGLFAYHPALTRAFTTFNGHILWDTSLSPRQRQLIILRVAAKRQSSYVWGEHSASSLDAGLTEDDVERVRSNPTDATWDPVEAALLRAVDELIEDGVISDATWSVLAGSFDVPQLADVVCTVGCYETTSLLFRTFGLEARS